jgi:hypothetical protein
MCHTSTILYFSYIFISFPSDTQHSFFEIQQLFQENHNQEEFIMIISRHWLCAINTTENLPDLCSTHREKKYMRGGFNTCKMCRIWKYFIPVSDQRAHKL